MVVPYRDASFDHYRRTAFDIGEWGSGIHDHLARAGLRLPRRDRVPRRRAARHRRASRTRSRTRSACTRRTTPSSGSTSTTRTGAEVRRMRRLVVSCHATVANYEYLVYWRFYQDGNIECEVRATGPDGDHAVRRAERTTGHGHGGRRTHLRALPPALPGRSARPRRRRRREHRRRGGLGGAARLGRTTRTGWPW